MRCIAWDLAVVIMMTFEIMQPDTCRQEIAPVHRLVKHKASFYSFCAQLVEHIVKTCHTCFRMTSHLRCMGVHAVAHNSTPVLWYMLGYVLIL